MTTRRRARAAPPAPTHPPRAAGSASCSWTWIGDDWDKTADGCTGGTSCPRPARDGTYTGEVAVTDCEGAGPSGG